MKNNKVTSFAAVLLCLGLISAAGCVSRKYVRQEMAVMDQKVEGVETTVEENQRRIREHDERLTTLGSLVTQTKSEFETYDAKIEEVKKYARGNLIFKEIIRNKEARFTFDSFELGVDAQGTLDRFVDMLVAQDKGVYLEIQGHTDSTGPESHNMILGRKRAEAVMDYLYKKHHIPLHRMEVISYGSEAPISDNATRQGRAENRRVEILVYE